MKITVSSQSDLYFMNLEKDSTKNNVGIYFFVKHPDVLRAPFSLGFAVRDYAARLQPYHNFMKDCEPEGSNLQCNIQNTLDQPDISVRKIIGTNENVIYKITKMILMSD